MATPLISINDIAVKEGQDAVFTVSLSQISASPVTVNWTVPAFSGPDIGSPLNTVLSDTLTFAPGEITKTITIKTPSNITSTAAIDVKLVGPTNALLGRSEGVATILDKDSTATGDPILAVRDVVVDEMAGTALFTVVLNKPATGGESFSYQTQDGTATAGQDYTAIPLATYTFAAGEMVKTISIPVSITNESLDEGDEVFSLALSSPNKLSLAAPKATAVIAANDGLPFPDPIIHVEGGKFSEAQGYADFYVWLDVSSANTVTVNYTTPGVGGATIDSDYFARSGTLSFAPGETFKTVRVPLGNDGDQEPSEDFQLQLSGPTNATLFGQGVVTATILDDDSKPPADQTINPATPKISVEDVWASENQGYVDLLVRLDVPLSEAKTSVSVNYTTINGTAVGSTGTSGDYQSSSGTLTFSAGEIFKTVRVLLNDDGTGENTEYFQLALNSATGKSTDTGADSVLAPIPIIDHGNAVVRLVDDDIPPVGPKLLVQDTAADERQGYVDFYVRLDTPSTKTVTVNYSTVNGTALAGAANDYLAQTGTLNFAPGETVKVVRIAVVDDKAAESTPTENFQLVLSSPANAILGRATGTATVGDSYAAGTPPSSVSANSVTVEESFGQAIFTVSLDKPATSLVTVNYGTTDGSAKAGSDYVSLNGVIGFLPGEIAKTVIVPIVKDATVEQDESFNLVLTNAATADGRTLTPSNGTATIKGDGGNAAPVVSINNVVLTEATDFAIFTISLDKAITTPVTFDYTTVNGTATAGSDFVAVSGSMSIPAVGTAVTIKVPIIADSITEGPEAFSLKLSNIAVNGIPLPISTLTGTATLKDNSETQGAVAVADARATTQDKPISFSVLANDIDPNNGDTGGLYVVFVDAKEVGKISNTPPTVGQITAVGTVSFTTPAGGSATIDSYGHVTYLPKADYIGQDSFTYTMRDYPFDGALYTLNSAVVTITVTDGTPKAGTYTASAVSGTPKSIYLLDPNVVSDPSGDALTVKAVSTPSHGSVVIGGGGYVIYTPAQNYSGLDSFTYAISDGGRTSTGVVSVTVTPATTGTAVASDKTTLTTGEDTPGRVDLLKDATNPNKETLTLKAEAITTAHGKVVIDAGGFAIYTPEAGYVGPDYFNFTMVDSQGRTSAGLVSVTVTQQRPTAVDDNAVTSIGKSLDIKVLANDTDPQNDTLTVTAIKTAPFGGTAVIGSNGTLINYKPSASFSGTDSFQYTVSDGKGHSATATVNVSVVSGTPSAVDDSATTNQGVAVGIPVLDNDSDPEGDPLSVVSVSVPSHGTAVPGKSGVVTYTPSSGFYGLDTFTYTISDGQGHTNSALVDVFVVGVNRDPTLATSIPDQTGIPTQTFFRYTISASAFSDPDPGDVLTYSASQVDGSALPSWLVFDPGSHDFLGTPGDGDVGSFNIKVTATDRSFKSASDIFTISVVPRPTTTTPVGTVPTVPVTPTESTTPVVTNHAPTTAGHEATLKEGGSYSFAAANFPFSDADAGDGLRSVKIVSLPVDGQLKLVGSLVQAGQTVTLADLNSGRLTYEAPSLVKDWAQSFVFQVSDGKALSSNTGVFGLDIVPNSSATRGTEGGDKLKGTGKADLLIAQGGNDALDGRAGGDRLYGEDGNDIIKGGAGNDLLSGGVGDDKLYGQEGKDVLIGGAGNDLLDGGAGKDIYLYGAKALGAGDLQAGGRDTIKATVGDIIAFDPSLWADLTQNGNPLDDLAGQALTGQINAQSNIAYDGYALMIDLNGDTDFNADVDMTIVITGQAHKVAVDPTGQFLVIG